MQEPADTGPLPARLQHTLDVLLRGVDWMDKRCAGRPYAMQLDNTVLADPGEVGSALGYTGEASSFHRLPFGFIEFLADADMERSRYYRHVLIVRMRMRGYLCAFRELYADNVCFRILGVADNNCLLRARREGRWCIFCRVCLRKHGRLLS